MLSSFRQQRQMGSLEWAYNMPEFRSWMNCQEPGSKESILWIRGTLGVGKTIMAGFFIDLLKCLYPDSIIAYFFCRSGQSGLSKTKEIIRTLSYQCIKDDVGARSLLEALRCKDFPINDTLSVGFLFEKLLKEPLSQTSKDVFIILDGLDEADRTDLDCSERPPRPEVDILLKHLASLSSARLLLISRPEAAISTVIPNSITKTLGRYDNIKDITAYIQKTINGSERLNRHFWNEGIDPFDFFFTYANGIFLWVVVVLHQLSQTRSRATFRQYLTMFSDAAGDMERLYLSVVSRFHGENRRWVVEILRWVVNARAVLTIEELQQAVESSLQDEISEFREFLEVDCGSLLHLQWINQYMVNVVLVHETLRSFLTRATCCPQDFRVESEDSLCRVVVACIHVLSNRTNARFFEFYAATWWIEHLNKLGECTSDLKVLAALYQFFSFEGCSRWFAMLAKREPSLPFQAEESRGRVLSYVKRWKSRVEHEGYSKEKGREYENSVVIHWAFEIANKPESLGQQIGKRAAEVFLRSNHQINIIRKAICLALTYYYERHGQRLPPVGDIKELGSNDFAALSAWIGGPSRPLDDISLGIWFFNLQLWESAIDSLERVQKLKDLHWNDARQWDSCRSYMWEAQMNIGNYEGAILAYEDLDDRHYLRLNTSNLALAYKAKGDLDAAAMELNKVIDKCTPFDFNGGILGCFFNLAEVNRAQGNQRGIIETLEKAVLDSKFGLHWPLWQELATAYFCQGDTKKAWNTYGRATLRETTKHWAQACLKHETFENGKLNQKSSGTHTHSEILSVC